MFWRGAAIILTLSVLHQCWGYETASGKAPEFKWAQNDEFVFITVPLPSIQDSSVDISSGKRLLFSCSSNGESYLLDLEFFGEFSPEMSVVDLKNNQAFFRLVKVEEGFWDRLLQTKMKLPYMKIDWTRYDAEEEKPSTRSSKSAKVDDSRHNAEKKAKSGRKQKNKKPKHDAHTRRVLEAAAGMLSFINRVVGYDVTHQMAFALPETLAKSPWALVVLGSLLTLLITILIRSICAREHERRKQRQGNAAQQSEEVGSLGAREISSSLVKSAKSGSRGDEVPFAPLHKSKK